MVYHCCIDLMDGSRCIGSWNRSNVYLLCNIYLWREVGMTVEVWSVRLGGLTSHNHQSWWGKRLGHRKTKFKVGKGGHPRSNGSHCCIEFKLGGWNVGMQNILKVSSRLPRSSKGQIAYHWCVDMKVGGWSLLLMPIIFKVTSRSSGFSWGQMVYHFYIDLKFSVLSHIRMRTILKLNSRSSWVTRGQIAYHCCMDLDSVDGTLYHRYCM